MRPGVAAAALTIVTGACSGGTHIGGGWYTEEVSTGFVIEAGGGPRTRLVRKLGDKRIIAAYGVSRSRFYAPDCVLWQSRNRLLGACGDRQPMDLARDQSRDWTYEADGASRDLPPEVEGGTLTQTVLFIPIDSVKAFAERQPRLDASFDASKSSARPWETFEDSLAIRSQRTPDLEARDHNGETALTMAVRKRNRALVDALLRAGADVNTRSNAGYTPLMLTMGTFATADTVIMDGLLAAGADVNTRENHFGWTPLIIATRAVDTIAILRLLGAGADATLRDNENRSVLDHAQVSNPSATRMHHILAAALAKP